MSKVKSPQEMEHIQAEDAILKEQAARDYVPERNRYEPVAYFEVSRYVTGQFMGLFVVAQLFTQDAKGKTLKKPFKKVIAEGVDIGVANSSIETAIRKRVYG